MSATAEKNAAALPCNRGQCNEYRNKLRDEIHLLQKENAALRSTVGMMKGLERYCAHCPNRATWPESTTPIFCGDHQPGICQYCFRQSDIIDFYPKHRCTSCFFQMDVVTQESTGEPRLPICSYCDKETHGPNWFKFFCRDHYRSCANCCKVMVGGDLTEVSEFCATCNQENDARAVLSEDERCAIGWLNAANSQGMHPRDIFIEGFITRWTGRDPFSPRRPSRCDSSK